MTSVYIKEKIKKIELCFITICFICLGSFSAHAEFFSSEQNGGWALDLPEGFVITEFGENGNSFFLEHNILPVRLGIKLWTKEQYERADLAMEDALNSLKADGEIDGFMWKNRWTSIAQYSFTIPGNATMQAGWGLCCTLNDNKTHFMMLCYTDANLENDCMQFIISVIDSLIVDKKDLRTPGPITEYAFPPEGKENVDLTIGENRIFTRIGKSDIEAERFVIDREYDVLTLYADKPNWKEAWQRYYRIVFKDSYTRLDECAMDIYNTLYPRAVLKSGNTNTTSNEDATSNMQNRDTSALIVIAQELLSWTQSFEYSRESDNADFSALSAILKGTGSDCDSRSLLLCVLLEHMSLKTELFVSMEYSHAVLGVALNSAQINIQGIGNASITVDGIKYFIGETTAKVKLGNIAQSQTDISKWIGVDLP